MPITKKINKLMYSKNSMRKSFLLSSLILVLVFLTGLGLLYYSFLDIHVDSSSRLKPFVSDDRSVVNFGVVSRYSPHLLYEGYQPLMDYLSKETAYQFRLKLSHSYQETIEQLNDDIVSAAFLGTYIYIQNRKKRHLRCILKPLSHEGRPYFHSVVITRQNSGIHSLNDLKNKRLALPSPLSYSANWLFREAKIRKDQLDSVKYFDFHNTVIYQVLKGNFDAGIVKDRVANAFIDKGIRIVFQSRLIPASPIVVHQSTDPQITKAIIKALLKIDVRLKKYRKLVKDWDAEFRYGFIPAKDEDYTFKSEGFK